LKLPQEQQCIIVVPCTKLRLYLRWQSVNHDGTGRQGALCYVMSGKADAPKLLYMTTTTTNKTKAEEADHWQETPEVNQRKKPKESTSSRETVA
jgi:hypothetical protein